MLDFYPNERFAVFIDSANFRRSKQSINMYVDDVKLLEYFRKNNGESIFLRIYHYESIPKEDGSQDRADLVHRIHRRLDFMAYNVDLEKLRPYIESTHESVRQVADVQG